jgi:hypothetical protein
MEGFTSTKSQMVMSYLASYFSLIVDDSLFTIPKKQDIMTTDGGVYTAKSLWGFQDGLEKA